MTVIAWDSLGLARPEARGFWLRVTIPMTRDAFHAGLEVSAHVTRPEFASNQIICSLRMSKNMTLSRLIPGLCLQKCLARALEASRLRWISRVPRTDIFRFTYWDDAGEHRFVELVPLFEALIFIHGPPPGISH
jgi:hypothetical protein